MDSCPHEVGKVGLQLQCHPSHFGKKSCVLRPRRRHACCIWPRPCRLRTTFRNRCTRRGRTIDKDAAKGRMRPSPDHSEALEWAAVAIYQIALRAIHSCHLSRPARLECFEASISRPAPRSTLGNTECEFPRPQSGGGCKDRPPRGKERRRQ